MPQAGERVQNSLVSGVLVRPDGLIVTNAHVVKGADEIRVVLADRREFDAKIVTDDERYDLALLRIDGGGEKSPRPRYARIGPNRGRRPSPGDWRSVRGGSDGHERHRFGTGKNADRHLRFRASSSRPTPPSIQETAAEH